MLHPLQSWRDFLQRLRLRERPQPSPVVLSMRRIFILPSRSGIIFALTLLAMLIGAMNYNNSLGFALTFLLFGMGLMAILHTFRNLVALTVSAAPTHEAIFAGELASFTIQIDNLAPLARYALELEGEQGGIERGIDIAPHGTTMLELKQPCLQRGEWLLQRFTLRTLFPLGLVRAWSPLALNAKVVVYPKPVAAGPLPEPVEQAGSGSGISRQRGSDEFYQIRSYQPGDSLRHIHWKALAKGQSVQTRQYGGSVGQSELILSWQLLGSYRTEERLSRLCDWCLQAEARGDRYGLELPHQAIAPDSGQRHLQRCLTALALAPA
ncbi:DUF58 domain-containing protein [Ectothiorhodospiraceae bacterium BW-2]|nr:DUF58 domain-containing protein [Ectothiorhodospiraceae bacterium BW-2]